MFSNLKLWLHRPEMFVYNRVQINIVHYLGTACMLWAAVTMVAWEWWALSVFTYFLTGCLGLTITFHRHMSHNSFQFKYSWMRNLFALFGQLGGTGSAILWTAIHIKHHKHADDEEHDPHGPHNGLKQFLVIGYPAVNPRIVKRFLRDKVLMAMHKYYSLILFGYWAALLAIGLATGLGPMLLIFMGIIPASLQIWISVSSTYFNHSWGYRNFELKDKSFNTWWLCLFNWGESWHNNHHKSPQKYDNRVKWWELDISALVIKYFLMKKKEV